MKEKVLIIDFGSQYTQLIARKVRELGVYSEIHPYESLPPTDDYKAIILSGSPHSANEADAPTVDLGAMSSHPILGICYGAQYVGSTLGHSTLSNDNIREYGRARIEVQDSKHPLFEGVSADTQVWMSHSDTLTPNDSYLDILAKTHNGVCAAFGLKDQPNIYGLQFHPEVYHTTEGNRVLANFLSIAGCACEWQPDSIAKEAIEYVKNKVSATDRVILGLSGGVDSTVAAMIIHKAIGDRLTAIFINNGLLRQNEYEDVSRACATLGIQVKCVDASAKFLDELAGITDPEQKRKAIGRVFVEIFEEEANNIEGATWLAQGTIYPDVVESSGAKGPSKVIKSHHNVGGLPDKMNLKLLEPLRMLFKDEVRKVGLSLGIDKKLIGRHPFPGPGLAIRLLGEITFDRLHMLRQADKIFTDALQSYKIYDDVWQAGAIFLPLQSVGVMGDDRTYEYVIALRAVSSVDGMTADWYPLPEKLMRDVSSEIVNKVKGINRVVYDISSKPPATIEWE